MAELIRRVREAGLEKLGQENVRHLMGELRLPKEILAVLFAQIDETKTGLYRVFAKEIRDFLEHTNFSDEIARGLTCVFLCGALLGSREVRADLILAPSADGYVGAWLGSSLDGAPLGIETLRPKVGGAVSDRTPWLKWSVVDGGTDALDLNRALGERRARRIFLGSVLALGEPLDGLLLVSVDGKATISVDGNTVWTRLAPHARGRAWDTVPMSLGAGDHVV